MSHPGKTALEPPEPGGRPALAFLIALALHASALLSLAWWRSEPTKPPGEQEIAIDLAPAMTEAPSVEAAEVASPLQPDSEVAEVAPPQDVTPDTPPPDAVPDAPLPEATAVEPTTVETVPAETAVAVPAEPVETVPAVPVEALAAEIVEALPPDNAPIPDEIVTAEAIEPEEATEVPPEETVTAETPPEPVTRPPPPRPRVADKPTPPRPEPPRRQVRTPPSSPQQGVASSSREDSAASAAAADPNAQNRYFAQVSAAVRERLRYPTAARAQGIFGTTSVRFTLHRSGRVISATLVRGSGHAVLDDAALSTVAPGSSLPAAPEAVPQQQITFVVPLRFNLQ